MITDSTSLLFLWLADQWKEFWLGRSNFYSSREKPFTSHPRSYKIINLGDELLKGRILNRNTAYFSFNAKAGQGQRLITCTHFNSSFSATFFSFLFVWSNVVIFIMCSGYVAVLLKDWGKRCYRLRYYTYVLGGLLELQLSSTTFSFHVDGPLLCRVICFYGIVFEHADWNKCLNYQVLRPFWLVTSYGIHSLVRITGRREFCRW